MTASPFFARIRAQVLQLTSAIPHGRVCTYQSIGEHLDVMPRHVAYILSRLQGHEKHVHPWHRVVGADGSLGTPKTHADGRSQAELLREEGIPVAGNKVGPGLERVFVPAQSLASGLSRQTRPADAPVAGRGRRRASRAR